jgi:hypothetical protein
MNNTFTVVEKSHTGTSQQIDNGTSYFEIGRVFENLTLAAAKKLLFREAKMLADSGEGSWQYSFETNNSTIYFHADNGVGRAGNGRNIVGRNGDTYISLSGYSFEVVTNDEFMKMKAKEHNLPRSVNMHKALN